MPLRITVHENDLEKHRELSRHLTQLSREIREFSKFCCYTPKEDARQMTGLLEQFRVAYGVHSDQKLSH